MYRLTTRPVVRTFLACLLIGSLCAFFGRILPAQAIDFATGTAAECILSTTVDSFSQLQSEPPEEDDAAEDEESKPEEAEESSRKDAVDKSDRDESARENEKESADTDKVSPATQTSKNEKDDKSNSPQVEIYIPSVTDLIDGYRRSRSAKLVEAFAGMMPRLERESDDDFDFAAIYSILEKIASWPDTSIALTTYTQDREGRPRWAIRLDWSPSELHKRMSELLELDETKNLLRDIVLREQDDASWSLELPEMPLAVLKSQGSRSMIASNDELAPPEKLFGQKDDPAAGHTARVRGTGALIYCRLNMEAGDEGEKRRSMLAQFSIVSDVRYVAMVDADGRWRERFNVRWNPLIGLGIKTMLKKSTKSFDCPRDAYLTGVMHLAMGEGLADTIAGLDAGTIGSRAGGDMAFSVLAGEGFFPIPDIFYQFNVRRIDRIKKEIREAIRKDTDRRKDDDLLPAWHESQIDGKVVFWRDPSADQGGSFSFATFRTVVFFELSDRDEVGAQDRLIIASTSMHAEDTLRRWRELRRKPGDWMSVPDSSKSHWQVVANWRAVYELVQPYLSMLASTTETGGGAPRADELADALSPSTIDAKIEFAGLDVRHAGPLPFGAAYVPGITFASLSATVDPGSEAAREREACRHLRVLHHHATLFKKDYGRWPATVAELDGYVDFASHPYLLNIHPKDDGLLKGFVSIFTGDKRRQAREEQESDQIDDTLYEIEWEEDSWKLMFREDEFIHHRTIYIDAEGRIHRVPRERADDVKTDDRKAGVSEHVGEKNLRREELARH